MKSKKLVVGFLIFSFLFVIIPTVAITQSRTPEMNMREPLALRSVQTFTGTVSQGSDSTQHTFTVTSSATLIEVQLSFSSSYDYDLSLWDNQARRTGGWTSTDHSVKTNIPNSAYSGYSANPEWIDVDPPATTGTWSVGCYAYSGSGSYTITVTITEETSDTTPPSVSITAPTNGATVSDSITISASASDNVGVDHVTFLIDGSTIATDSSSPYQTTYDTNSLTDGSHTITAVAYDAAGNTAQASVTVTVDNGGTPDNELTSGVPVTGSLSSVGQTEMWYIIVGSNAESMRSVLTCGSADFDLYGRLNAEPTTSTYDWRGYTSGGEDITINAPSQGTHYIPVIMWSGGGSYTLTVTITYQQADTTPPSVSITAPSNGATISGTVTVSFTASDANGISGRAIKIDGTTVSTGSSFSWDTTSYTNAQHTILAQATDPSGNTGSDSITVTVDNQSPPGGNELTSGQPVTGSLTTTVTEAAYTIAVDANAQSMHIVLDSGSSDFDVYQRFNTPVSGCSTTSCTGYDNRGYTSGGEDITVNSPSQGTHYILVKRYSGTGAFTLTVTVSYSGGSDWGNGGKYAILFGISNYQSINDLSYCDEDVTDVYNYLIGKGYEIRVYGDSNSGNYPRYDGLATESNVRSEVQGLANHAQSGDQVVIWYSGHGGATGTYDGGYEYSGSSYTGNDPGTGYSYLLFWDFSSSPSVNTPRSTSDESYSAQEMGDDMESFASGVSIGLFLDACQSGGFGWYLSQSARYSYWYIATTCGVNGYGYDASQYSNGQFTYWYVQRALVGQGYTTA
ncbi:MAG: hypothetical protein FK734_15985, partial [Asgard group archaeon]|nr:hypothetical protein [Asgard group archaeon]